MSEDLRPSWLVRQENASMAEARTRAFLLDRFWILERSVDIEGADFIVQRRLTARSLLDRDPPRLGFVQAKFYQSSSTTQYVHREYILDPNGNARAEFFLICHTGMESHAIAYFLTAAEIARDFALTSDEHSEPGRYALPGTKVLLPKHQIHDARHVLDSMDTALHHADFGMNRGFLSWALFPSRRENRPIDPQFLEPLDNRWGDIPREFDRLRRNAERGYWELQEAANYLGTIIDSADPEEALLAADELFHQYRAGGRTSVPLPDDLFDEDFLQTVREHKRRHALLKGEGLLNAHAALRRRVLSQFIDEVAPRMPLDAGVAYVVELRYEPVTFAFKSLETHFDRIENLRTAVNSDSLGLPITSGIVSLAAGEIHAFVVPSGYGYFVFERGSHIPDPRPWSDKLGVPGSRLVQDICESAVLLRFPELSD